MAYTAGDDGRRWPPTIKAWIRAGRGTTPEELQRRPELIRPQKVVESKRTKGVALALVAQAAGYFLPRSCAAEGRDR